MSDEMQAMCFFAGANSIFYGDKLLTTDNPEVDRDIQLFKRLGITAEGSEPANDSVQSGSSDVSSTSYLPENPTKKLYHNAAAV